MSRLPEPQALLKVWRVLLVHLPDEVLGLLPSRSHAKTEVWNRCSYVSPIFRSIFHHDGRNRGLESNSTDETPFENGASSNVYDQNLIIDSTIIRPSPGRRRASKDFFKCREFAGSVTAERATAGFLFLRRCLSDLEPREKIKAPPSTAVFR
jgi:hypothetical protein